MLREIISAIEQRNSILLTSHARPDGDAIGSALALLQIVRGMGKSADVVLADNVPAIYSRLPFAGQVIHAACVNGRYDAAVILECDSIERTRLSNLDGSGRLLINIDHHNSAKNFADINWIDPHASAVAEMVYDLAREAGVKITPDIATCLYTAVLTDTGSFCYVGTTERTFELAQELVRAGADPARIAQKTYFANPQSKMRLLGCALSRLHRVDSVAWMYITQQDMHATGSPEEDCEGLVNYALGIEGVEAAIFLRELPDGRFRVSLRSKGAVDVAELAEHFGGGGHSCASGLAIDGPLERAVDTLVSQIESRLAIPRQAS